MKKTINIIIKDHNSSLGPINSHKKVALGYAFNYLIPKQIAEIATKGKLKHITMLNNIQSEKRKTSLAKNLLKKEYLDKRKKINIRKKIGQNQQIFGKINENEITQNILQNTGQFINKKQIHLPNIKTIGIYNIKIDIDDTLYTFIQVQIIPNNIE